MLNLKYIHILRCWGLVLEHMNLQERTQCNPEQYHNTKHFLLPKYEQEDTFKYFFISLVIQDLHDCTPPQQNEFHLQLDSVQ